MTTHYSESTNADAAGTSAPPRWRLSAGRSLWLDRPRIMAIINATPDSFSDGGLHLDPRRASAAAARLVEQGAALLDVGGEPTRAGAEAVPEADQIERVVPVIRAIREAGVGVPITIDTTRSAVARAALDAGADAVNDVSGGTDDPAILSLAAERGCGIILMHRLRAPADDRYSDRYTSPPVYGDVVEDVMRALRGSRDEAARAGVAEASLVLDPGLGFGKSVDDNLRLISSTHRLQELGRPLLGAASRKSFVGRVCVPEGADPPPPTDRLGGSIAMTLAQLARGVRLFRVHDVEAQSRAIRAWWAVEQAGRGGR